MEDIFKQMSNEKGNFIKHFFSRKESRRTRLASSAGHSPRDGGGTPTDPQSATPSGRSSGYRPIFESGS